MPSKDTFDSKEGECLHEEGKGIDGRNSTSQNKRRVPRKRRNVEWWRRTGNQCGMIMVRGKSGSIKINEMGGNGIGICVKDMRRSTIAHNKCDEESTHPSGNK